MLKQHRNVLSNNHEFLVSEIPMDATLEAIRAKRVLTWHDLDQLKTLRHQGRRALARYFLGVLPYRGPTAFDSLLESLQEANAQHIVDLLLAQNLKEGLIRGSSPDSHANGAKKESRDRKTPTDSPVTTPAPDPHEYAVRLSRNAKLIREFVDPAHVTPTLTQNKVMTEREADMVHHLHGKNKKWDLILAVLLQRGERAYQAFMAALLQREYNTMFHTIQETSAAFSESEEEADDNNDDGVHTAVRKSPQHHSNNNDDEDADELIESDDDVKEETRKSRHKSMSVEDRLLRDSRLSEPSKADDALLQTSSDLQGVETSGGNRLSRNSDDQKSNMAVEQSDPSGYYGGEDDDDNSTDSARSARNRRATRRKSNTSLPLKSVAEESEDNVTPRQ